MKSEKKTLSHNVYSVKNNYRIRIYRNDHKIFEKQMKMPKMQYMSFSKEIISILQEFQTILSDKARLEDSQLSIIDFANAMNKIFFFQNQMEKENEHK